MRQNIKFIQVIFFILVSLYLFAEEKKEGVLVKAKGFASGPNYVVRQIAIEDAIKNGFEQYLLSIVPEKYQKCLRSIVNKSSKYIISFRIVDEISTRDTCSLEIELELDDESINRDVSTFLIPYLEELPSILILKNGEVEDNLKVLIDSSIEVLVKKLSDLKFNVNTDAELPESLKNYYKTSALVDMESKKRFVMATDFDIVVFLNLKSTTEKTHPSSDFVACRSSVEVEIFRSSDGKLLESFTSTSVVNSYKLEDGIRQSLEDSLTVSVPRLISSSVLGCLNKFDDKSLIIKIEGFEDGTVVDIITAYLEKITYGCKTEVLCNLPGLSKIKLYYDGPVVHIVDSLQNFSELEDIVYIKKVVDRNVLIVPRENK